MPGTGGRLQAALREQRARLMEAQAQYESTVIEAVGGNVAGEADQSSGLSSRTTSRPAATARESEVQ